MRVRVTREGDDDDSATTRATKRFNRHRSRAWGALREATWIERGLAGWASYDHLVVRGHSRDRAGDRVRALLAPDLGGGRVHRFGLAVGPRRSSGRTR